jgi:hypothetical protein
MTRERPCLISGVPVPRLETKLVQRSAWACLAPWHPKSLRTPAVTSQTGVVGSAEVRHETMVASDAGWLLHVGLGRFEKVENDWGWRPRSIS